MGCNLADVIESDLSEMSGIGYNVVHKLVNASDYGVPQNRQRVLFVGIRKDIGKTFRFPDAQDKTNLTLRHILPVPENVENNVTGCFLLRHLI